MELFQLLQMQFIFQELMKIMKNMNAKNFMISLFVNNQPNNNLLNEIINLWQLLLHKMNLTII